MVCPTGLFWLGGEGGLRPPPKKILEGYLGFFRDFEKGFVLRIFPSSQKSKKYFAKKFKKKINIYI